MIALVGAVLISLGQGTVTHAQEAQPRGDGPAINSTVFRDQQMKSVTAVTEVFGRSQRVIAAIVEYDRPIRNAGLAPTDFEVTDRRITRIYANDRPDLATDGRDGAYVILELNAEDQAAIVFSPKVEIGHHRCIATGQHFGPVRAACSARHGPAYQHPSEKSDRR